MPQPLRKAWTLAEFLAWERQQEDRYEFVNGVVFAMVGGSIAHHLIKSNIGAALHGRLRGGPCRVFIDGGRLLGGENSLYPDVVVTCSPVMPSDDFLTEPTVIVEVLSRSTEERDRNWKWEIYQALPSLQHYLLVHQGKRRIELFTRTGRSWQFDAIEPPAETIALGALGIELPLDDCYEGAGI